MASPHPAAAPPPSGVPLVKLGSQGFEVSSQGLGCMGMSGIYGPPKNEQDMIQLIHHAIDSGITFLDTSDVYGPFLNEILLGKVSDVPMHRLLRISMNNGLLQFVLLQSLIATIRFRKTMVICMNSHRDLLLN
jgi:hypothetical protein